MIDEVDPAELAAVLRRVLDEVDAGHIEAEPWQHGYLVAAADTLTGCPDVFKSGQVPNRDSGGQSPQVG